MIDLINIIVVDYGLNETFEQIWWFSIVTSDVRIRLRYVSRIISKSKISIKTLIWLK